jgi:hypothetical protein
MTSYKQRKCINGTDQVSKDMTICFEPVNTHNEEHDIRHRPDVPCQWQLLVPIGFENGSRKPLTNTCFLAEIVGAETRDRR